MYKFGLIGFPLSHSYSQLYFEEKFRREKLDHLFELFPIPELASFPELLISQPQLKGLAITIPHKEGIIKYLHQVDAIAHEIGAVNCISITDGFLYGYNTDQIGFERSLTPLLQAHHKNALILGSGGSSKAVQFILNKLGIRFRLVSSSGKTDLDYGGLTKELFEEYSLIVNCTPVGMFPADNDKPAIPYDFVTGWHLLYDLVYNPEETLFLKEGKRRGAVTKNGIEMFQVQAEENWKIWNA